MKEIAQEEFARGFYQRMGVLKCEQLFKDEGEIGKKYRKTVDNLYNIMELKEDLALTEQVHRNRKVVDPLTPGQIIYTKTGYITLSNDPVKVKKRNKFKQSLMDKYSKPKSKR